METPKNYSGRGPIFLSRRIPVGILRTRVLFQGTEARSFAFVHDPVDVRTSIRTLDLG